MRVDQQGIPTWEVILFSAVPLIVLLIACEVGLRLAWLAVSGSIDGRATHFSREIYPSVYDHDLGYVPRPNSSHSHLWDTQITLGNDGIRSNGVERGFEGAPTLAVGDSFTFGDEVGDQETWPAHLENVLGRPVLNAGVFGYGLDQAVLRAEDLVGSYGPSTLIISFTPADVARCEMMVYYSYKPYFEVRSNRLVLRRDHMPEALPQASVLKRLLRHSVLVHAVMSRLAPTWWLQTFREVRAHRQGLPVACLLMSRVADLAMDEGLRVLVLGQPESTTVWQYDRQDALVEKILACAQQQGLFSLNLVREYRRLLSSDPGVHQRFFNVDGVHMSDEGNGWVADKIARTLQDHFPVIFGSDQQEQARAGIPGDG